MLYLFFGPLADLYAGKVNYAVFIAILLGVVSIFRAKVQRKFLTPKCYANYFSIIS